MLGAFLLTIGLFFTPIIWSHWLVPFSNLLNPSFSFRKKLGRQEGVREEVPVQVQVLSGKCRRRGHPGQHNEDALQTSKLTTHFTQIGTYVST